MRIKVRLEAWRAEDREEAREALGAVWGASGGVVGRVSRVEALARNKSPHVYGRSKERFGRVTRRADWYLTCPTGVTPTSFEAGVLASLRAVGCRYPVGLGWEWAESGPRG